jgi:hypothetical protein
MEARSAGITAPDQREMLKMFLQQLGDSDIKQKQ